jgi:hypothetical protein
MNSPSSERGIMPTVINIICPQCKATLKGPDNLVGRKVRCKGCGTSFTVPAPSRTRTTPAGPAPRPAVAARGQPNAPLRRPTTRNDTAPKPAAAPPPPPSKPKETSLYGFMSDEQANQAMKDTSYLAPTESSVGSISGKADHRPYGMTDISLAPRCGHCAKEMPSPDAIICLHCGYNNQTRTHIATKHVYEVTAADRLNWKLPGMIGASVATLLLLFDVWIWLGMHAAAERNNGAWWTAFDGFAFQIYSTGAILAASWFAAKLAYDRLIKDPEPPELEKK